MNIKANFKINSKKDGYHALICTSIISIFIMILFFLNNIIDDKMSVLRADIEKNKYSLEQYTQFIDKFKSVEAYQKSIGLKQQLLDDRIPNKMQTDQFLVQISELTKNTDVILVSFNKLDIKNKDTYKCESFELQIKGNFFNTLKFLQLLNKNKRLINIKSGEIFRQNDIINTKLTLQIYANN